jgi:hypothetical protein
MDGQTGELIRVELGNLFGSSRLILHLSHQSPGLISIYLAGEDKSTKKCSRHYRINHLTSINVDIERPDDGNVLVARQISDI